MMKLSMIVEVYNEERCLPYCLKSMLPYVDECIIIDGSENGPSTDKTPEIISIFKNIYPEKIISLFGTFRRDDGAWDDTAQSNKAFSLVTGDFVMRTHADIVFENMEHLRDIVEKFPEKKVFYCPLIEFFYDTKHIRLYGNNIEPSLPVPITGDVPVIAMSLNPRFEDIGKYRRSSLQANGFGREDILYMPDVKRFHFGWVKPFKDQVLKHVKYIMRGDHEAGGEELKNQGIKAVFDWAIKHVLSYKDDFSMFDYAGEYPEKVAWDLRNMSVEEGYEEFIHQADPAGFGD